MSRTIGRVNLLKGLDADIKDIAIQAAENDRFLGDVISWIVTAGGDRTIINSLKGRVPPQILEHDLAPVVRQVATIMAMSHEDWSFNYNDGLFNVIKRAKLEDRVEEIKGIGRLHEDEIVTLVTANGGMFVCDYADMFGNMDGCEIITLDDDKDENGTIYRTFIFLNTKERESKENSFFKFNSGNDEDDNTLIIDFIEIAKMSNKDQIKFDNLMKMDVKEVIDHINDFPIQALRFDSDGGFAADDAGRRQAYKLVNKTAFKALTEFSHDGMEIVEKHRVAAAVLTMLARQANLVLERVVDEADDKNALVMLVMVDRAHDIAVIMNTYAKTRTITTAKRSTYYSEKFVQLLEDDGQTIVEVEEDEVSSDFMTDGNWEITTYWEHNYVSHERMAPIDLINDVVDYVKSREGGILGSLFSDYGDDTEDGDEEDGGDYFGGDDDDNPLMSWMN